MTHKADNRIRIALLLIALVAIGASFAIGASDMERTQRFAWLAVLGLIVVTSGTTGTDIIQAYTKRRPVRMHWGKPRADLGAPANSPDRELPNDWRLDASLRLGPVIAALAGSAAAALIFGTIGYALAGSSSTDGRGLAVFMFFGAALWFTGRYALRLVTHRSAFTATPESVTLGIASGYLPALTIGRQDVVAIEYSPEHDLLGFVTATQRFEVSTTMYEANAVAGQLAGLWPDTPWHELSPDTLRTRVAGLE